MKNPITILVAALVGTGASAGGLSDTVMGAAPTTAQRAVDWSGFFAGASLGYGASDSEVHDYFEYAAYGYSSNEASGGLAGLQAGYNFQRGNLVYGGIASIAATSLDDSFDTRFCSPTTHSTKIDSMSTVRGRIGLASRDTLFYATAGVGHVQAKTS